MKNDNNLRSLLKHCDKRFYPYTEKVLNRLPEEVRNSKVLLDSKLKIISFDGTTLYGCFVQFQSPIKHTIILNESILSKPEFDIIHTIAHELAHKVVGKGRTALGEMEAENLVAEWGFEAESKAVRYHRPILETEGFNIGYEWARDHDSIEFEEFYDEWNEGRLSSDRYEHLHYTANTTSILYQMGYLEESKTLPPDGKPEVPEGNIVDDGSLDKGIIEGIMCFLREKKAETQNRADYSADRKSEFIEQLRRANAEIIKVLDHSLYGEHFNDLSALRVAGLQIIDMLESGQGDD